MATLPPSAQALADFEDGCSRDVNPYPKASPDWIIYHRQMHLLHIAEDIREREGARAPQPVTEEPSPCGLRNAH